MSGMSKHSILGTLAALSAVLLAACGGQQADARPGDTAGTTAAAPVTSVGPENVVVVQTRTIATGPSLSGSLVPEREATVRAQVAGPVLSTHADEGSRLSAGALLARIDDRTMRDQFLGARSGMTTAQSAADVAARELARYEKLAAAGAVAERDLEVAQRANVAAQSQLADARARLSIAQKQLADAQVRAPFNGIVSVRSVSAGDVVQPGAALFTIVDPASMRLEGSVPAAQLSQVRVGVPATFTVSGYPDRVFEGKIVRINPSADPATGQVRVVVSIPNSQRSLVGGLFAEGRVKSESRDAAVVGTNAVDARGVRPSVLRLKGGQVERVEVELGIKDDATESYEIVSGVAVGDTLLVGAAQGITPGTPVRVAAPNDRSLTKN